MAFRRNEGESKQAPTFSTYPYPSEEMYETWQWDEGKASPHIGEKQIFDCLLAMLDE